MSDIRTIIAAIAHGDIDRAQTLGRATPPPAGTIVVGPSMLVYANPYRDDNYSWRCGSCPWTANNYKTRRGAEKSADKHAEEHPGIKVRWITRPIGA